MNVFIIPSWYPSDTNPIWGIFCKEQAEALAEIYPDNNVGVSLWGQTEERNLLYLREPIRSVKKCLEFRSVNSGTHQVEIFSNLFEFSTKALTWNRKIFKGNIKNIIKANETNLLAFQQRFGKPDIIHAHVGYPGGYIALYLSKKYLVPYIITEHMGPFPSRYYLKNKKLISELINPLNSANALIALNTALVESFRSYGIKNDHVKLIPNMVNERFFKPSIKSKVNSKFIVLFIGGLIDIKGVPFLIEAIKENRGIESLQYRIGGEGVRENDYKEYASKLDVSHRIQWLGILDRRQVLTELQNCDMLVLPSISENMPVIVLEALACGKPVLATKSGGHEEVISEINGLLVEKGNAKALADGIKYIKEHYLKFKPEVIRDDFEKKFSRSVVTSELLRVYKEVIEEY